MLINISDVFKTIGSPSITYVERNHGEFENTLKSNLSIAGKVCLITGPSKTGKSTLYLKVMKDMKREPLIVRCDDGMTSEDIWRKALEEVDFSQLTSSTETDQFELSSGGKVAATLGWSWLAKLTGELNLGVKGTSTEGEIRQKIISKPSSKHLLPILRQTQYLLVIEDFHYLTDEVKTSLFQQCKAFVDSEVSIIILGTTHHAVDLAYSNKDLVGRIAHIEVGTWSTQDLQKIIKQGFEYLNVAFSPSHLSMVATESVGLPIITQSVCFRLFSNKNILTYNTNKALKVTFGKAEVLNAFHGVATTDFSIFEDIYTILITGFRKKARKYNTYELLLLIFTIDPIVFKLKRFEIDERLSQLKSKFEVPPAASVNSTLGALGKLQKRNDFELLEWSSKQNTLYILEPSFLFYLRWKEKDTTTDVDDDFLEWFTKSITINIRKKIKVEFDQDDLFSSEK